MLDSGKIRIFSAVLLSSTVFINSSQAMEVTFLDDQAQSRTTLKFVGEVVTQASENIKEGCSTAKINFSAYYNAYFKKEYKPFLGLVVHGLISSYAKMSSFAKDGSLDPTAVRTAINNLTPLLMEYMERAMNKRTDLYGISEKGERVTIYEDKTLFGRIADGIIPANMPLRTQAVSFFNNSVIQNELKNELNRQLAQKIEEIFRGSGFSVSTSNEVSDSVLSTPSVVFKSTNFLTPSQPGTTPVTPMLKSEEKPVFQPITTTPVTTDLTSWATDERKPVSQPITTTVVTLKKPMGYDFAHQYIWPHLQQYISGFLSDSLNGVATRLTTELDGYRNKWALSIGGLGYTLGEYTIGTLGSYGLAIAGYVLGGATFDRAKKEIKVELPRQISNFLDKTCGLTRETYVLNYLNPKPTDIERGLFGDDYELRDRLTRSALTNFVTAIFKGDNESSQTNIKDLSKFKRFLDHTRLKRLNDQEGAKRSLYFLSENKRKEIETNIQTFPSYLRRMKQIQGITPTELKVTPQLKETAVKITAHMNVVANALSLNESQTNTVREKFLSFSVKDQDLFLEIDEKTLTTELESEKPTVEGFEAFLKKVIKDYSSKKHKQYLEDNKDSLEDLKSNSLTEGLSENESVLLHQQLKKQHKLSSVLEEHAKSKDFPETRSLKETHIEMLAKQHAVKLVEIFQKQIEQHGVIEKIKEKIKKELSTIDRESLNKEQFKNVLLKLVAEALANDPTCEKINESILNFRNRDTKYENELKTIYKETLSSVFMEQRSIFYNDIGETLWKETGEDLWDQELPSVLQEPANKEQENIAPKSSLMRSFTSYFSRNGSQPQSSQKMEKEETTEKNEPTNIDELVRQDETELEVFGPVKNETVLSLDQGKYDVFEEEGLSILNDKDKLIVMREAVLAKFVNDMKLPNGVGSLGDTEFNIINEKILEEQLKNIAPDYSAFFKNYKKQIVKKAYELYPKNPFYSLQNTIDTMREENNNFMQKLFDQEKE